MYVIYQIMVKGSEERIGHLKKERKADSHQEQLLKQMSHLGMILVPPPPPPVSLRIFLSITICCVLFTFSARNFGWYRFAELKYSV